MAITPISGARLYAYMLVLNCTRSILQYLESRVLVITLLLIQIRKIPFSGLYLTSTFLSLRVMYLFPGQSNNFDMLPETEYIYGSYPWVIFLCMDPDWLSTLHYALNAWPNHDQFIWWVLTVTSLTPIVRVNNIVKLVISPYPRLHNSRRKYHFTSLSLTWIFPTYSLKREWLHNIAAALLCRNVFVFFVKLKGRTIINVIPFSMTFSGSASIFPKWVIFVRLV